MGSTTPNLALRYPYVTDVISHTNESQLADDIATALGTMDTARTTALKMPTFYGQRNATQSMAVSVETKLQMDTEVEDTHGMINIGTDATRVTCTAQSGAGVYEFSLMFAATMTSWTRGDLILSKNGVFVTQQELFSPITSDRYGLHVQVAMIVTDFIQFGCYHEGGGTTNTSYFEIRGHKVSV
jgi:hypothetical protein